MTQPNQIAQAAEAYAHEAKRLEHMRVYRDNLPDDSGYDMGVGVAWSWGSSAHPEGHKELQRFASRKVNAALRSVIDDAIRTSEDRLEAARRELQEALK